MIARSRILGQGGRAVIPPNSDPETVRWSDDHVIFSYYRDLYEAEKSSRVTLNRVRWFFISSDACSKGRHAGTCFENTTHDRSKKDSRVSYDNLHRWAVVSYGKGYRVLCKNIGSSAAARFGFRLSCQQSPHGATRRGERRTI
jgi:hypothetical protein